MMKVVIPVSIERNMNLLIVTAIIINIIIIRVVFFASHSRSHNGKTLSNSGFGNPSSRMGRVSRQSHGGRNDDLGGADHEG